jgi:hypothetical protein
MVVMEMVKEFTSGEALTVQPHQAPRWLDPDIVGQTFNNSQMLVKYLTRFIQDFIHRAPVIGLIDPRIDLILSL